MEKDIEEIRKLLLSESSPKETGSLPPVTLAWIGDGVYSLYVRKFLSLEKPRPIKALHHDSLRFVTAESQSKAIHKLIEDELTEEEIASVKRGRNVNSTVPKHASVSDYRYATGFETLLGELYLTGQKQRLEEIILKTISYLDKE